ncbi:MAG: hypothetical protein KAI67_03075 [Candidatus Pacebacteria bacterium]|nr:hypothetical protein [Candidatus Paceibacterota bacterium]
MKQSLEQPINKSAIEVAKEVGLEDMYEYYNNLEQEEIFSEQEKIFV